MLGSGLAASRLVPGRRCEVSSARASRAYSARVEKRPGERTSLCAQAAGVDSPSASRATEQPGRPKGGSSGPARSHETDVVVIGAGIGGLSCGAILASYGLKVTVVESHSIPGGAAHAWVRDGYHFESGPSLYSGMGGKGMEANPMAHVFQAIGEDLELKKYDAWNVFFPEGQYLTKVGLDNFHEILMDVRGPEASQQWRELQELMRPLAEASTLIPPAAFRGDAGVAVTAIGRYLPRLFSERGRAAAKLAGPFSNIIKDKITDKFILNYLDLLCFLLSGLPANGTIAAEVAFMFNEWYRPNACLEFPVGGSQAMVDALVRGLRKHGGQLYLSSHVNEIVVEGGRAAGVKLRNGSFVKARKAVVSNAFLNTTQKMLPPGAVPASWAKQADTTPLNRSFMHLHLGFDATGLEDLELHHIVVNSWEPCVDSEQNVVLISIASVMDPSLAPAGKHTLHAYLPATEPYDIWDGLDRSSLEYKQLKEERSQVLWKAVERVIPDIRSRVEVSMVGTPLTHERFLRRHRGTYGPGIIAGQASFPGHTTPVPGLYMCGDSTFPGIGLPAVAASGAIAANTLVPIWDHWKMLDRLGV